MFDANDLNRDTLFHLKIQNDILEKFCNQASINTSILHIACDKRSKEGCVYIKCSSNEASGKIFQNLNGTWYNGKLLNVKFLRSDRYAERFPDSINNTSLIQHKNSKK